MTKVLRKVVSHNYDDKTGIIKMTLSDDSSMECGIHEYMQWNRKKGWGIIGNNLDVAKSDFNGSWPNIMNGLLSLMVKETEIKDKLHTSVQYASDSGFGEYIDFNEQTLPPGVSDGSIEHEYYKDWLNKH